MRGEGTAFEAKREKMRELVRLRRDGWLPEGCHRLGDAALNNGFWDEDEFVVPWSKSASNYDAKVMLIAQDWDSFARLSMPLTEDHNRIKLAGRDVTLKTNKRIDELLLKNFRLNWEDTFSTDVFPFVKPGKMRGKLVWKDFVRCAETFALRQ